MISQNRSSRIPLLDVQSLGHGASSHHRAALQATNLARPVAGKSSGKALEIHPARKWKTRSVLGHLAGVGHTK